MKNLSLLLILFFLLFTHLLLAETNQVIFDQQNEDISFFKGLHEQMKEIDSVEYANRKKAFENIDKIMSSLSLKRGGSGGGIVPETEEVKKLLGDLNSQLIIIGQSIEKVETKTPVINDEGKKVSGPPQQQVDQLEEKTNEEIQEKTLPPEAPFLPLTALKDRIGILIKNVKDFINQNNYPVVELPLQENGAVRFYKIHRDKDRIEVQHDENLQISNGETVQLHGIIISNSFYDLLNKVDRADSDEKKINRFTIAQYLNENRIEFFDEAVKNLLQIDMEEDSPDSKTKQHIPYVRVDIKGKEGPFYIKKSDLNDSNFQIDREKMQASLIKGLTIQVFNDLNQKMIEMAPSSEKSRSMKQEVVDPLYNVCKDKSLNCIMNNKGPGTLMMEMVKIRSMLSQKIDESLQDSYDDLLFKEFCLFEKVFQSCNIQGESTIPLEQLQKFRREHFKRSCRLEMEYEVQRDLLDWQRNFIHDKYIVDLVNKEITGTIDTREKLQKAMTVIEDIRKDNNAKFEQDNALWIEEQNVILKQYLPPEKYEEVIKDQYRANRYYDELLDMQKKTGDEPEKKDAIIRERRRDELEKELDRRDQFLRDQENMVSTKILNPELLKEYQDWVAENRKNYKKSLDEEAVQRAQEEKEKSFDIKDFVKDHF